MSLLNNKQYKIDIKDANGKDYNLAKQSVLGLPEGGSVNWVDFCNKITVKQKRYGEPSSASLSFIMLSGNGAIGRDKNAIITFPAQIGDKVEITVNNAEYSSDYISMASGGIKTKSGKLFVGYIFNIVRKHTGEVEITCYDILKYLQGQRLFFYYNQGATAMQVIQQAQKAINLGRGDAGVKFLCDEAVFGYPFQTTGDKTVKIWMYDKNFIQIVNWLLNRILMIGIIQDADFATYMCFLVDYDSNQIQIGQSATLGRISTTVLDEKSLMTSFEITESIENDVYNTFYYMIDEVSTDVGRRIVAVTTEEASIKQCGSLCYYQNFSQNDFLPADTTMTLADVSKVTENFVKIKNKPKTKLSVKALGNPFIHAGMLIGVKMPEGLASGYMTFLSPTSLVGKNTPLVLIDEITHTIENGKCEMEFTASVALSIYNSWKDVKSEEIG